LAWRPLTGIARFLQAAICSEAREFEKSYDGRNDSGLMWIKLSRLRNGAWYPG
jgi:hypothetical protein